MHRIRVPETGAPRPKAEGPASAARPPPPRINLSKKKSKTQYIEKNIKF